MVRLASIGSSSVSEWFLDEVKRAEGIQLSAVYSRDLNRAEEFARKHGAEKWYDSLEILAVDDNIDAVYIASPNYAHRTQALLMMSAGKHVICEKALASNEKEAQSMFKTSSDNGVVLLEAMRTLHDPGFKAIQDNLASLGAIRQVDFRFCQYSSRYDAYKAGKHVNIFDPKCSAGALMDIGVYCVEPLVALFSMPEEIKSSCHMLEENVDGAGVVVAKYPSFLATLTYSKITNHKAASEIQGEEGTMVIERISDPRKITIYYRNGEVKELDIPKPVDTNICYEIESFVKAVENNEDLSKYRTISLETMRFMDIVRKQNNIVFPADI